MPLVSAFVSGLLLGASLIIAIGAQNAFILRQGLLRRHVFVLCLICAVSDAALIALGVGGLGTLISQAPVLIKAVTIGGVLFLGAYAVIAFRRALHPQAMNRDDTKSGSLKAAIATCLAFTFLNPHVYLDMVVLIGGLSAHFEDGARMAFGVGAALVSFIWFFGLGYGARLLEPVFARPAAWRVLDVIIGLVMSALAISLAVTLA